MYESWYGFQEKPFNLTPDPKYLYLSARHAEAFAHLEFGHRERGGFIVITGEVGTGKTTLARYFLTKLGPETRTAVVLYPALTAAELLRSILDDLHVRPPSDSLKGLIDALHAFLLESRAAGHDVVLLIDEAQDLSAEVLEQVRLISNLETDTEKLIQIILIGQSELQALLSRHELRQLAQRVTARYHLTPLSLPDTAEYIRHRLSVAGGAGKAAFASDALREVHRLSGGVPRLVNLICDRALLAGFVKSVRVVTAAMVRQAASEVAAPVARTSRWRHAAIAVGALALAAVAFALVPRAARAPAETGGRQAPLANRGPEAPLSESLDHSLRGADRDASLLQATTRVAQVWGERPLARTALRTHLAQLRAIDLPAVLELFHPARADACFVALLRLNDETAVVAVGDRPEETVPARRLDELWTRQAILIWPEEERLPVEAARLADWARPRLAARGYAEADLGRAVRRFQEDAHLVSDGVLGPRTRMVLFSATEASRPRLSRKDGRS